MPRSGIWRTKTIEQSIAETDEPVTKLNKTLDTRDVIVFGVSVVIGAGIFTTAARTAGDISGPSVWLSFILAAVACGLAAVCYAEFSSLVPVAGSAYTFSYATFGEFAAWIIGWNLALELSITAAVVSKGWSTYLQEVFGLLGVNVPTVIGSSAGVQFDWAAVLLVAVLSGLLAVGTKLSARVSLVITLIKVAVVLFVILAGVPFVRANNYTPFIPPSETSSGSAATLEQSLYSLMAGGETSHFGIFGLLAGASLIFFAFIGFDIVATTAEETRNPQRTVPRGILTTLAITTGLYVAVALIVTGMTKYTNLSTKPDGTRSTLATAFALNGVNWAATVISVGALIGVIAVVMVTLLGQVRVLFAMSRDGLLPTGLAKTGKHGTPVRATLLIGVIVAFAAGIFPADKLEEMVNVGTLFAFILVSAGVLVLRRTRPDLPRAFRVPAVPLVPVLAIVACLWLMLNLTVVTWIRFAIWLMVGIIFYFGYSRKRSRLAQHERRTGTAQSGLSAPNRE